MNKQDIRQHSDQELSLLVFNDETLYRMRKQKGFIEFLNDFLIYTDEQLAVLRQDLEDDAKEGE